MRNYILLLSLSFLFAFQIGKAQSQNQSSSIYVYESNGEAFYLVLNGVRQNYYPQSNVQISGLVADNYSVEIIFKNKYLGKIGPIACPVVDATFQYGQSIYELSLNQLGYYQMQLKQFFPGFTLMPTNHAHHVVQYHSTAYTQAPVYHSQTTTVVNGQENQTQTIQSPIPNYNGPIGCADWPIEDAQFSRALRSIQAKDFDRTKLVVAKQITRANCLTSAQVKQIARLFSFDSGRLEFAKFAYDHTYDVGNYFIVNDVFDFDKNVRELSQYIANQ